MTGTQLVRDTPDIDSLRTRSFPGSPSHRRLTTCRDTERPATQVSRPTHRKETTTCHSGRLSHLGGALRDYSVPLNQRALRAPAGGVVGCQVNTAVAAPC